MHRVLIASDSRDMEAGTVKHVEPQCGDVVILGRAPPGFGQKPAIVTQVASGHCTAVVLDDKRRTAIGECWPSFQDLRVDSDIARLGARVRLSGFRSASKRQYNDCVGTVVAHPQEGHPCFIQKSGLPPVAVVCVRLDCASACSKPPSLMVEWRFLEPSETEGTTDSQLVCRL